MTKKRKFTAGAWKEEAFRESPSDSSSINETTTTMDSGYTESDTKIAVNQDANRFGALAIESTMTPEESDNVETPEKKQKIEGTGTGESTPTEEMLKEQKRKLKKEMKKQAKLTQIDGGRPSFLLSRNYHVKLKLKDLRDLVVYLLTETKTLPWIMVKNKFNIERVVLLYIGGLEPSDFGINYKDDDAAAPVALTSAVSEGPTSEMANLKKFFDIVCPIKAGGSEKNKMYAPVNQLLSIPLSNTEKAKREAAREKARVPNMTRDGYMLTLQEMRELEFPLPSYLTGSTSDLKEGWIETNLIDSPVTPDKRKLVAMDCEMCMTEEGSEVTRVTLLDEDGKTIYDELVMPTNPIIDYLTKYSGMTEERLSGVTTSLTDVQKKLKELVTYDTILVGHSLENDMKVLKFAHPFIIDTTKIYHHTRGPPSRPSLRWLAYKWLSRRIQNGGENGHDSIEDALACMDLAKLKFQQGQGFGEYYNDEESIFARIKRYNRPRTSAVIDDEDVLSSSEATTLIKTSNDSEVVAALPSAMKEHHFVWARLRDLEIAYGKAKPDAITKSDHHPDQGRATFLSYKDRVDATKEEIYEAARNVDNSLAAIVEAMPPKTALLVTSGQGDPRDMLKYQDLQRRYQALYNTVSLSSIAAEDRFDDEAHAALELGVQRAKNGVCFFMVK